MKYINKLAVIFVCFFLCSGSGWAYDYDERLYLVDDAIMQTQNGQVFVEIENEHYPVSELFLDDSGYYILTASYQHWLCSCCGYDLNMYRDYCFKCSKPRWWCE